MGTVILLQPDPELDATFQSLPPLDQDDAVELVDSPDELLAHLQHSADQAELIVLGSGLEEPIRLAERIRSVGTTVPVLILSAPDHYPHLVRARQFSPFLSEDVFCRSMVETEDVRAVLQEAITRVRQQRSYRATIAALNARLTKSTVKHSPAVQYLDRLLDYAPIGVVAVDRDGLILAWNRKAGDILGMGEREALGTPLLAVFPDTEQEPLQRLIADCSATAQQSSPARFQRLTRDGGQQFVEVTAAALVEQTGEAGALVLVADVTRRVRAEHERQQVEEQLAFQAQVLSQVSDVVIASDNEHRITYWNPAAEQLYGFTAAEVLDRPLEEITHYQWLNPTDEAAVYEMLATKGSWQGENWHTTGHGERLHVESTVSVLKDTQGRPIGLLAVIRDITERKRAEEAERFLAQASTILASTLDYETTIEQITRLAVPTLADWCTLDILEPERSRCVAVAHVDPAKEALLWKLRRRYPIFLDGPSPGSQVLRSGQSVLYPQLQAGELPRTTQDAEHLRLITALAPVAAIAVPLNVHGKTIGVMTLASIRPERRLTERDVRLAEELAGRAAIAIENARLYREARQAIQVREEFVSIASHELKTPLTTIKTYAQLLARQVHQSQPDHERLRGYTTRLQEQVDRLERLVADLLDASRIHQGRLVLQREHGDLAGLAQAVLERFAEAPERKACHRLVLDAPQPVAGDWDLSRLDQVLTNLVSNALKYSPEGGEVRVTVLQIDGQALLSVSDQGIGIPPEEQGNLFQSFVRGDAVRSSVSGTGLGLYITRQIVEQHGGTISVQSEPGRGTCFLVQLPLALPDRATAAK